MKYFDNYQVRRSGVSVELDGWYADSVWEYHLPPDQLPAYHDDAARYINRLLRIPPAGRKRLKQVIIRCPAKGCLLTTIYEFPIFTTADDIAAGRDGGVKYLYTGRTSAGIEVWDIVNYSCACAQVLYWRAGCRCGTASLDRPWMLDLFSIAYRWHSSRTTEAEEIAKLPEHLRPFWGKQVFHPEPAAWHARRPRRSRAKVFRELQSRARTA